MSGYNENRVRHTLLTVRDANVLSEMAAGWRASIGQLNEADDKIRRGMRGLRDGNQLGDATREAAIDAFRDMRDYVEVQRDKLAQTARALDAASGALSQAASTVSRWNMVGDPVVPGPAPVADAAAADQAPYLAAVTLHGQQTAGYNQAVADREEEARQLMESMERTFARSEDKIREQHGIAREERPVTETEYPEPDWPGPPPVSPEPSWPELPVFPPVDEGEDKEEDETPDPRRPERPGPGPGPGLPPTTEHHGPSGVIHASTPDAAHQSTSVAGSSQSGVAYQGSGAATAPGSFGASMSGAVPTSGAAGLAGMPGMSGMSGAMGAAGGAARAAGASTGAGRMGGAGAGGAGGGRAGSSRGASGRSEGASAGRSGPGGKGSQKASGTAKSASSARGGAAGGAGGRKKDQKRGQADVFTTEDHWLDGEDTAPDVLR